MNLQSFGRKMNEKGVRSQLNKTNATSSGTTPTASIESVTSRPTQSLFQPATTTFSSPSLSSSILNGLSSLNIAGSGSTTNLGGSSPWPFLAQHSTSASARSPHASLAGVGNDSSSQIVMLQFFDVVSSKLERLLSKQETLERLVHDSYDNSQRSQQSSTLSMQAQLGERLSNITTQSQGQINEKLVMLNAAVTQIDNHLRRMDEMLVRLDSRLARCEYVFAGSGNNNNSNNMAAQARGGTSEGGNSQAVNQIQQQAELMNRYLQEFQRTVAIASAQPNIYGSGAIPSAIAQNSALLQALLTQPYYSMYNQQPPPLTDAQQQGMLAAANNRQMAHGEAGQHQRLNMPQQQQQPFQQQNQPHLQQRHDDQLPASQLPAAGTNYTLTNTQAGGPRQITHQQAKNTPLPSTATPKPISNLGGAATAAANQATSPLPAGSSQQQQQRVPPTQQVSSKSVQGGGTLAQLLSGGPIGTSAATGSESSALSFGQSSSSASASKSAFGTFGGAAPFSQQTQQQSSAADGNSQSGSRLFGANNNNTQPQDKAATPGASAGSNKSATISYAPFGAANNSVQQPTGSGFSFTNNKQATPSNFGGAASGSSAGGADNNNKPLVFGQQQPPAVDGSAVNGEKGGFRLGGAEAGSRPTSGAQSSSIFGKSAAGSGSFVFGGGADTSSSGGAPGGAAGGFRFGSSLFNAASGAAATGGASPFSFQMPSSSSSTAGPSNQAEQQDEDGGGGAEGGDEQQQNPEGYVPNVDFQPIVKLEKLDRVVTGEEEEWPIFSERSKLFRYDTDKKEWKERGLGNIRLLKHKTLSQVRCVMRSEQVFKVRCNHIIGKGMRLNDVEGQPAQKTWVATDYSENDQCEVEMRSEMFRIRFKNAEQAQRFQELFSKAVRLAEGKAENADFSDDIIDSKGNDEEGAEKTTPMKKSIANEGVAADRTPGGEAGGSQGESSADANRRALEENVPLFKTL